MGDDDIICHFLAVSDPKRARPQHPNATSRSLNWQSKVKTKHQEESTFIDMLFGIDLHILHNHRCLDDILSHYLTSKDVRYSASQMLKAIKQQPLMADPRSMVVVSQSPTTLFNFYLISVAFIMDLVAIHMIRLKNYSHKTYLNFVKAPTLSMTKGKVTFSMKNSLRFSV